MNPTPPRWAEALLRIVVRRAEFENISGDLLEEYRDTVVPARGVRRADVWYAGEVLGFVLRGARIWAVLFGGVVVARTALDWLSPVTDFHTRANVSTFVAVAILIAAGFAAAWRSGSFAAGAVGGAATAALAGAISIGGALALLAIRHDAATLAAIDGSGGLAEALTLPVAIVIPAAALGLVGGVGGSMVRRWTALS
jgi:hypothetical protein